MAGGLSEAMQAVLTLLEDVRRVAGENQYVARCPAHRDSEPSLGIAQGKDGRVLFNCYAGCDTGRIVQTLGLDWQDVFVPEERSTGERRVIKRWDYVDERGNLLYQRQKYQPKAFDFRRPDGHGEWVSGLNGVRKVLYRLPEVIDAVGRDERVWVVEGEKDADRLAELGYAATNAKSPGRWLDHVKVLTGADVVIVPDHDSAGAEQAEAIAEALHGTARRIRILELPGLREHGDLSDWLDRGGDVERLEMLLEETPEWGLEDIPYSREAEDATVGEMIRDPERTIEQVRSYCDMRDFYFRSNRTIVRALFRMWDERQPINRVSLPNHLEERDELQDAGGRSNITRLLQQSGFGNVADHAEIVRRKSAQRDLISFSTDLRHQAVKRSDEIPAVISDATVRLEEIHRRGTTDQTLSTSAEDLSARLIEYFAHLRESGIAGIPTGYSRFDRTTKGFRHGGITLIGASRGSGKSAMMVNMALRQAKFGLRVGLLSLEMSETDLGERAVQILAGADDDMIMSKRESDRRRLAEAITEFSRLPVEILYGISELSDVLEGLRYLMVREACDVIYLDHFHYIDDRSIRSEGPAKAGAIARRLATNWKHLSGRVNPEANFVWLSQLRKDVDQNHLGRPRLDDFRDTGMLADYAHLAVGLSSPELVDTKGDEDDGEGVDEVTLEASILKNRHGRGGGGLVRAFNFKRSTQEITEVDRDCPFTEET